MVSVIGLCLGGGAVLCALEGRADLALVLLIWAGAADLVDGKVSRKYPGLKEMREFGYQLDSLVDACSFGACPLVLLYLVGGMRAPWEVGLLLIYLICVIMRLARFNLTGLIQEGERRYWEGLPTTYMALFVPVLLIGGGWMTRAGLALLSLGMVSRLRVPRPGRLTYLLLLLAALGLSGFFLYHGLGWPTLTGRGE